jgi:phospholipase/carboxylesterase
MYGSAPPLVRDEIPPLPVPPAPNRLLSLALRLGLLLTVVFIAGRCALGVADRPRFLGLATARSGASLSSATRVVIVLHGFGGDRNDLRWLTPLVLAQGAPEHTAFVYAEGPYRVGFGRAWWASNDPAERADSERRVSELVDEIVATSGLSPDRVFLAGFSQGAALALDVALARPGNLGGVVAFSPCRDSIPWTTLAAGHASVRGFIAHGRNDRVCPFGGSSQLHEELAAAGHDVRFVPFDGPHWIGREGQSALAGLLRGE